MEYLQKLESIGVVWRHTLGADEPHAVLASGKHSDGFMNLSVLATHPDVANDFAKALAELIAAKVEVAEGTFVVGSAMGGITVGFSVASHLGTRFAFAEKTEAGMNFARFESERGDIKQVVLVEDVHTTGSTSQKTLKALEDTGLIGLTKPFVFSFINRSGKPTVEFETAEGKRDFEVASLVELDLNNWNEADCPLCGLGSKVVKPKPVWNELTAKYKKQS